MIEEKDILKIEVKKVKKIKKNIQQKCDESESESKGRILKKIKSRKK